jgi:hypothetical protein
MTREEFVRAVVGRRITAVGFPARDSLGHDLLLEDGRYETVEIETISLDDGTTIELTGSYQIGVADVDARIVAPPARGGTS